MSARALAGTVAPAADDTTNFTYDLPDPRRRPTYTITATGQGGLAGYAYSIDREQRPLDRHDGALDLAEQRDLLGAEEGRVVLSSLHQRGFTLIELLVGMTLLAVLLGLGAPAMGTYLQNSKLASAAASYYTGLQMARTEAIRRNVRTEFVLTDTRGLPRRTSRNAAGADVSGRNWVVRAASGCRVRRGRSEGRRGRRRQRRRGGDPGRRLGLGSRCLRRQDPVQRLRRHRRRRAVPDRHHEPRQRARASRAAARSAAGASPYRPAARSPRAIPAAVTAGDSRACP